MRKIVIFIIALVFAFPAQAIQTHEVEDAAYAFFERELLDETGGVYANLLTTYPSNPAAGVNHEMLSESAGLIMEYDVYSNREDAFAVQHQFVDTYLKHDASLLYNWRIGPNLEEIATSSAIIDDFRILDAYMQAADKWNNQSYRDTALAAADKILQYVVVDGVMTQGASWNDSGVYPSSQTQISYLDLSVMQRFAVYDSRWTTVEQRQAELINGAAIGNGLYWLTYDLDTDTYIQDPSLSSIQLGIIGYHLAEAGYTDLGQQTLDFFKSKYETEGEIVGAYTPLGISDSPYQDFSVYSLVSEFARFMGDTAFADEMLAVVTSLQVDNPSSVYDGAFQWSEGDKVYAFGQTNALRALGHAYPVDAVITEEPNVDSPQQPVAPLPTVDAPVVEPSLDVDTGTTLPHVQLRLQKKRKGSRHVLIVHVTTASENVNLDGRMVRFYRKTKNGTFHLTKKKKVKNGVAKIIVRHRKKLNQYQARFRPISAEEREMFSRTTAKSNVQHIQKRY